MADEYIRREDALRAVQRQRGANRSPAQNEMLNRIKTDIIRAPAADVAPVLEGKWIVHYTTVGNPYTECASCHTDFSFKTDKGTVAKLDMRGMLYCPHCGANMEGGIDDASH